MNYFVLDSFRVKTSQGEKTLQAGQIIILPEEKVAALIEAGKIKPEMTEEQRDSYEERAGIFQFDAGLSKQEAERLAWCFQPKGRESSVNGLNHAQK